MTTDPDPRIEPAELALMYCEGEDGAPTYWEMAVAALAAADAVDPVRAELVEARRLLQEAQAERDRFKLAGDAIERGREYHRARANTAEAALATAGQQALDEVERIVRFEVGPGDVYMRSDVLSVIRQVRGKVACLVAGSTDPGLVGDPASARAQSSPANPGHVEANNENVPGAGSTEPATDLAKRAVEIWYSHSPQDPEWANPVHRMAAVLDAVSGNQDDQPGSTE